MSQLQHDPFGEFPDRERRITPVTRRDIFDYFRTGSVNWWGRMDEVAFLGRLYDLEALPSTDRRFPTAAGDIYQHRERNFDWDNDWIFADPRFGLASGPDEVLLEFLAQVVHPVVQPDADDTVRLVLDLNKLLAPDGWMLKQHTQISGRPAYAPARTEQSAGVAVEFAHAVATRIDAAYISRLVTRMEDAVDTEPELAIGTAKEFVESVCKTILDERQEPHSKNDDIPTLVRKTTKALKLTASDVGPLAPAAETIKRMLMNLATVGNGLAEIRNAYGSGHGKSKTQAANLLDPRHARLAVGAAATLGTFLYETHEAQPI